jgi:hypothetical protein
MNAAQLPQDTRWYHLRFTVDRINPSSHHIYFSRLGVRGRKHARMHTHTTFCLLVEQIGLPIVVTQSQKTNLPSFKKKM